MIINSSASSLAHIYLIIIIIFKIKVYVGWASQCLWRLEEDIRSLQLELQVVVGYQMWILGTELRSSGSCKHSRAEPSLQVLCSTL